MHCLLSVVLGAQEACGLITLVTQRYHQELSFTRFFSSTNHPPTYVDVCVRDLAAQYSTKQHEKGLHTTRLSDEGEIIAVG